MPVFEQKRDQMIEHLQKALSLADELKDSVTGYLIERASDKERAGLYCRVQKLRQDGYSLVLL